MNRNLKNILLTPFNLLYYINPRLELSLMFRLQTGYKLDWKNLTTFSQKLQWIKLYDKNPLMPKCVDKYAVREFVCERGCGELLNGLLWEGFDVNKIPFDELPSKFVIKVTHGSGGNIICRNKSALNIRKTKKQIGKWLKETFIPCYGEWFYGVIKPRIVVENFLSEDGATVPNDYKIFCFSGIPQIIAVDKDRFTNRNRNLYDTNWNLRDDCSLEVKSLKNLDEKPQNLSLLLAYAKKLSMGFKHARIDFYIVENKIYFGEITFTNGAGFDKIAPRSFDEELGSHICIND